MPRSQHRRRGQAGTTLLEVLIATGVASLVLVVVMSLFLFSLRSFAALVNYVDLDNFSRTALDVMTSEIRQADELTYGSPTRMDYLFTNPTSGAKYPVSFVYNADARTLTRIQGSDRRVLLEECDFLKFDFFKRNSQTNSFDLYETAAGPVVDPSICKAVQMRWVCSRRILQEAVNTESVQSARVVVRKK